MIKRIQKLSFQWNRRGVRDAFAIAGICIATYFLTELFDLFDRTYEFAKRYNAYDVDDFILVVVVFGLLMPIYALRRAQDLKSEIIKREEAERKIDTHATQLATAVNNIPQGIIMFGPDERLVVCNRHYLEMYNLSPDVVKPGAFLLEVFRHRVAIGLLTRDARDYRTELLTLLAQKQVVRRVVETSDGREIAITDYPMADGGWVATHEDRTESRRREESFRLLFDDNPIVMWVYDCETLRFLAVNDAAVVNYGYSRQQFLTMTIADIRATDVGDSPGSIRTNPETKTREYIGQHQRADGTKLYVTAYSRLLNYENREARLVAVNNVTAQKNIENDLRRMKKFLDAVIENVPMPIVVKTAKDGRFTLINKASEELHGYKREETIGKTLYDIFPKERADFIAAQDEECFLPDEPVLTRDHTIPTPKGDRMITSKKVLIQGDDGAPEYLLTLIDDVTERRFAEQRIVHMAHSDSLTNLPNRTAFNECLAATLKTAKGEHRSFAILCVDLDGFKEVNDIYGHAVGDSLLCRVAERLRVAAGGCFIARLGGDEFTIVADNGERSSIVRITDRLLAAFVEDFDVDGHRLRQNLSVGVAVYPAHGADAITLLKNADSALYQAKSEHPGSVQYFEPEMAARLRERGALQAELSLAIEHNEFQLHYQPQVTMSGEISGFEAMARWYSPKRGPMPPEIFIPLAEESSLILTIGEWVLRDACTEAASWKNPLKVAINVSPIQFRHGDLPRLVHSVLLETGLAPHRLELEITEGVLIVDFSRALSILHRLKSLGVNIVLDDFGTGYSSLSYLRAFPFDKLKIDRSFISDLESNQQSIAIVRAVIGLSKSLNIPVLAEGVETKAQHAFLTAEGCDEVQGYLTGRPLAITDYAALVGSKIIIAKHARAV